MRKGVGGPQASSGLPGVGELRRGARSVFSRGGRRVPDVHGLVPRQPGRQTVHHPGGPERHVHSGRVPADGQPLLDPLVDVFTIVACTPCAICEPPGPFPRCTDTIACAPGFNCFDYGVGPLAAAVLRQSRSNSGYGGRRPRASRERRGPGGIHVELDSLRRTADREQGGSELGWRGGLGSRAGPRGAGAENGDPGLLTVPDGGAESFAPVGVATTVDASVHENPGARRSRPSASRNSI